MATTDRREALRGARVVLGVSGGIAAYKAVEVCRRLMDAGAHVSPVLTQGATRFVGALTFSALASEPARTSLYDGPEPIPHTRLGQRADLIIVVPATARVLAAYAAGLSSDLLTATLIATRAPVVVCPAMHTEMWEHPSVVDNLATLRRRGVHVVEPEAGRLAGGDAGTGRLAAPDTIVDAAGAVLASRLSLAGVRAVVTAGGTREPIDPVRFIGNRSSGKQGHAVADELAARGAHVVLVTTTDRPAPPGAEVLRVETAAEMQAAVGAQRAGAHVVVMAAAVADFRPKAQAATKIKKGDGVPDVILEATPDILAGLGAAPVAGQLLVGFAAETAGGRDALLAAARRKLASKHVDLVVANDVGQPGVGFSHDTNEVLIVGADGSVTDVALTTKTAVAAAVVDAIAAHLSPPPPHTSKELT
ncbi:bifunctional phosphopantothenoylcysteine decarboxylase/phosphopantothenate--cysteine ligase CoaBC [Acidiferrimicrobium sp. IK]|uniref:bifunctional phosphopantothenoylcysteine decarboxylase/phosphopantothenate--cysteine ligase CoaBC n=1 Tax=Acidiferrimicrobium sp. IK TaxID=2871700 RepID=UPI0021CB55E3|nr:bifunctional phosphopantothenoylcysteine decarboxylase/phosphopantothenate--cysteine ligase CoaBC [Acidiferrimicrobium sp. IK]MCU4184799.1 bifunctional phosphopantothenoylcysteine decarboxylase/phosphopantothenate--cysteine ligase CoaBC [Acidiferrimicrobium sp. IK]